jgi:hypothetical protein
MMEVFPDVWTTMALVSGRIAAVGLILSSGMQRNTKSVSGFSSAGSSQTRQVNFSAKIFAFSSFDEQTSRIL